MQIFLESGDWRLENKLLIKSILKENPKIHVLPPSYPDAKKRLWPVINNWYDNVCFTRRESSLFISSREFPPRVIINQLIIASIFPLLEFFQFSQLHIYACISRGIACAIVKRFSVRKRQSKSRLFQILAFKKIQLWESNPRVHDLRHIEQGHYRCAIRSYFF